MELQKRAGTVFLSIIVPVYNAERYLSRCLDSLLSLDTTEVEIILVDDGSTDTGGTFLDNFAGLYPHLVVIHQPNGGYGRAMNTGLENASGRYVGIVEPDDCVAPQNYSVLIRLAKQTGAHIIKGDYYEESHGKTKPAAKTRHLKKGECLPPLACPSYLYGHPSIWSAIYRRDWLSEHHIRFNETPGAAFQDLGFSVQTWLMADSIVFTDKPVYRYTKDNPASSIHQRDEGAWKALTEVRFLQQCVDSLPADAAQIRSVIARRIFLTARVGFLRQATEKGEALLHEYSLLLNRHFAPPTLDSSFFSKAEWKDYNLLCKAPGDFEANCCSGTSVMQKIFSIRHECGRAVLRLAGLRIPLSR